MIKQKEGEPFSEKPKRRPVRFGVMGAPGSGKTELAGGLGEIWNVNPIEERHWLNSYLPEFYANPERKGISLKCQLHFLGLKAEDMAVSSTEMEDYQRISSTDESIEIFDPTVEQDALYPLVHRAMDFIDRAELDMYNSAYTFLRETIIPADIYAVLEAPAEVLNERIIEVRKRDIEQRKFFENYPDYLPRLATALSEWTEMVQEAGEAPIIIIDSANNNFVSNPGDKERVLGQIENEVKRFLAENRYDKEGRQFIVPDFLQE